MTDAALRLTLDSDQLSIKIQAIQLICREKRINLLRDLIKLLDSEEVGYFVEECLPSFGNRIVPLLKEVLTHQEVSAHGRERVAGLLALFGERSVIPDLLEAIKKTTVNQTYIDRLAQLAPQDLSNQIEAVLRQDLELAIATNDVRVANYFAKLILTAAALGHQFSIQNELEQILHSGQGWVVRAAAAEALYTLDPAHYRSLIQEVAEAAHPNHREILAKVLIRLASK